MAFPGRAGDGWLRSFMIFKGIQTSIAKKPYIFVILPGVRTPCPPSGFVQGNRAAHAFFKLIAYAQKPSFNAYAEV